jgi:uncharacterized membrane protein YoaK (UPF0700 family)
MSLSAAAGYVEIIGYLYLRDIYPGIMTGNTVQLGLSVARTDWAQVRLVGSVIAVFFFGCVTGSALRKIVARPGLELLIVAVLVAAADIAIHHPAADPALRFAAAMSFFALAMALQGEALTSLGGVSIQTIVVTNTMVKLANGLVELVMQRGAWRERPAFAAAVLPGLAWLSYVAGAAAGAKLHEKFGHPLLIAAAVFACVALDFLHDIATD